MHFPTLPLLLTGLRSVLLFLTVTITLSSCAPSKGIVPPGTIPTAKTPSVDDEQYGHNVVQQLTERYKVDNGNPEMDRIQEIVDRLTKAAKADTQPWHVYLFKDDTLVNAAATRGNHIFIWTGMLHAAHSDGELAAILGHEIGHVLAGHTAGDSNEEVKRILIQILGVAAGVGVSIATGSTQMGIDLSQMASSVTTTVGEGLLINPYSRGSEFEADQIGLELMAEAKYDPQEAITFWTRASTNPDFSSSLSFLSTHPPAPDRLEKLKKLLPFAEARYRGNPLPYSTSGASTTSSEPVKVDTQPTGQVNPPSGDSFDFRTPNSRAKPPPTDTSNIVREWRVIADKSILFEKPSNKSRRLGEFRRGGMLSGVPDKTGWIRVLRPDQGYLILPDLVEIYSK